MSGISNSLEDLSFDNFDDPLVEDIAERLHRKRKRMFEDTSIYRVILVVSDWVMLTQFRLRITSKWAGIDINLT